MRLIDAGACPCNGCLYPFCLRPGKCKNFNQWLMSEPSNSPLTLDELRKMDSDAVWVCRPEDIHWGHMALIRSEPFDVPEYNYCSYAFEISWSFLDYGKTWLAYRRKPEEGK